MAFGSTRNLELGYNCLEASNLTNGGIVPIRRYVDLDGTLAHFEKWDGPTVIGKPIPKMVQKVKKWLAQGDKITIFTSRIYPDGKFTQPEECEAAKNEVENWCVRFLGVKLDVTYQKGVFDILYDDRAEHIVLNTGETTEERLLGLIGYMRSPHNSNDTGILDFIVKYLKEIVDAQNE